MTRGLKWENIVTQRIRSIVIFSIAFILYRFQKNKFDVKRGKPRHLLKGCIDTSISNMGGVELWFQVEFES